MNLVPPPVKLLVATDIAFFTVKDNSLHICLIERMDDNSWALPGGFIKGWDTRYMRKEGTKRRNRY